MALFEKALEALPQSGLWVYGPEVFRTFCERHGVRGDTAAKISVDLASRLPEELQAANVMVLRLGPREGGQTAFALVRHERRSLEPFFLFDDQIFTSTPETFIPDRSMRAIFPFGLLPKLSD